jgi:hypothetical protein
MQCPIKSCRLILDLYVDIHMHPVDEGFLCIYQKTQLKDRLSWEPIHEELCTSFVSPWP